MSCTQDVYAQLYTAAYGDKSDPAILFLHGGPGYNSFSFEASTADRLVKEGYYVVTYDQRGSGRSLNPEGSKYNFEEAIADLNSVYELFDIEQATLIGHSWGGALGVVYAEAHPEKVKELVLVSAPMDYQQTFKAIIKHAKEAYTEKGSEDQLKYISMLESMDTKSLEYATYCFMHAMASGQYKSGNPAENVEEIKQHMLSLPDAAQLQKMTREPVKGFYDSENYTTLKLYDRLKTLKSTVPVYGIYGTDDGLFDEDQFSNIKIAIGAKNFTVIKDASHSVFIDQQEQFVQQLKTYIE